jgi:arsenate reductase (thioredoxin)
MKVLFICWANSGRSQFGEAFFEKLAPGHSVKSAGTHGAERNEHFGTDELPEPVLDVMAEAGFDLTAKWRKQLTQEMADWADVIVAICDKELLPAYVLNSPKMRHWDVPDAKGTSYEFHQKVRDVVKERVEQLITEIDS